jgi:hypothetical protein
MEFLILPSELAARQRLRSSWALSLAIACLAAVPAAPARSQSPPPPAQSIVEAARNAREQQSKSTTHPKIFTNDDLGVQFPLPSASAIPPESSSKNLAEVPTPQTPGCNNPEDQRLKMDLQVAQEVLDQIRRELSYEPAVISGGNVDLKNFKPGSSGLAFGSPPLLQTQPQSPARVSGVILEGKIASLKEASRIACDSPKDAGIQKKLDSAEKELRLLQREFDLDRAAYYSKPNYAKDTTGKAKLDTEQQQIQSLQSEVDRLKEELPPPKTNQVVE